MGPSRRDMFCERCDSVKWNQDKKALLDDSGGKEGNPLSQLRSSKEASQETAVVRARLPAAGGEPGRL